MRPQEIAPPERDQIVPGLHPPVHVAEDLTGSGTKAIIMLHDQRYTLHITKQGKLLLTK